ncbi:MATE family efflux transporter [Candidatus Thiosymbion oneisti]|uniref:MATE family efflux transporter n=1 Tax=Candidatus Thiosymbion oneisti TaxID=589554 RepID=UPI001062356E|nr:MATE family efflux transporter [Candidatus Thiosymbion oneisti]
MTARPSASKFPTASDHRATLTTALPLGISYVGVELIGITDSIMLGRLSTDALSAAGLALSIFNVILVAG